MKDVSNIYNNNKIVVVIEFLFCFDLIFKEKILVFIKDKVLIFSFYC